jgi:hypothetical protein
VVFWSCFSFGGSQGCPSFTFPWHMLCGWWLIPHLCSAFTTSQRCWHSLACPCRQLDCAVCWSALCPPLMLTCRCVPRPRPHAAFSNVWLFDRILMLCHLSVAPLMRNSLSHLTCMQNAMSGLRAVAARWVCTSSAGMRLLCICR